MAHFKFLCKRGVTPPPFFSKLQHILSIKIKSVKQIYNSRQSRRQAIHFLIETFLRKDSIVPYLFHENQRLINSEWSRRVWANRDVALGNELSTFTKKPLSVSSKQLQGYRSPPAVGPIRRSSLPRESRSHRT